VGEAAREREDAVKHFIMGGLVGLASSLLILTMVFAPSQETATRLRMERIKAKYPGADIVVVPSHTALFVARLPDGSVRWVESQHILTNNEISLDIEIIPKVDGYILRKTP
jgi:hypothetical protein